MVDEFIPRIKWSDFELYVPLRIIIKEWSKLKTFFNGQYLVVPSEFEYKGSVSGKPSSLEYQKRKIELCVPYTPFVRMLRKLPVGQQKMIIRGGAVIEVMKTYRHDNYGMRIMQVEEVK